MDDYRALFDAPPRPIFVSDRETLRILEVNPAACDLYGWSRDELLDMTLRDIEASFAGKHHTKSGTLLDVSLEVSTTTFRGRPAALTLVTDVSSINEAERSYRLVAEQALRDSQQRLEFLISATSAVTYSALPQLGGDFKTTFIGSNAKQVFGYEPHEFLGSDLWLTRIHPDDLGIIEAMIARMHARRDPVTFQYRRSRQYLLGHTADRTRRGARGGARTTTGASYRSTRLDRRR